MTFGLATVGSTSAGGQREWRPKQDDVVVGLLDAIASLLKPIDNFLSSTTSTYLPTFTQSGLTTMNSATPRPIAVGDFLSVWSSQANFQLMIESLAELLTEEEEDDYGVLRPTAYAFETTLRLLFPVAYEMGLSRNSPPMPYGAISTDYAGGIRIEWRVKNRQVRLIVPATPDGDNYIYFEEGDRYNTVHKVSPTLLETWLRWVTGDRYNTVHNVGTALVETYLRWVIGV